MLDELRKGLLESYKHRLEEKIGCVGCGRHGVPVALHVLEFYHEDTKVTPPWFVPMSRSRGTTRGSAPLCNSCCPACKKCGLPIATLWTGKFLKALRARYPAVSVTSGNGLCKHVHLVADLTSLLRPVQVWPKESSPRSDATLPRQTEDHKWVNEELGAYFQSKPRDSVWKTINPAKADLIQTGFLELWRTLGLERYKRTDDLPAEAIDRIAAVANSYADKHDLNPSFIILVTHQYVDADPLMRQTYRTRWVAFMAERSSYAPSPESYLAYIKVTYFGVRG